MSIVDRFTLNGVEFKQIGKQCNKEKCKCKRGELHGPYWHSFEHGSSKPNYIGKTLPQEVTNQLDEIGRLSKRAKDKLILIDAAIENTQTTLHKLYSHQRAIRSALNGNFINSYEFTYLESIGLGSMCKQGQ